MKYRHKMKLQESIRGTTNAMKSFFIPATLCAKKKPGMYCFAILKTGCATGGIDSFGEMKKYL